MSSYFQTFFRLYGKVFKSFIRPPVNISTQALSPLCSLYSTHLKKEKAKNNHYTSDHWKVGGTGHNGENILREVNKQQYNQAQKAKEENASLIPNQNEHDETPAAEGSTNRAGDATKSSNSSSSDY